MTNLAFSSICGFAEDVSPPPRGRGAAEVPREGFSAEISPEVKELLEENYYASINFEECEKEDDEDSAWNEDRMTIDQIRYLSVHGWHPMMRSHYKELLSRLLAEMAGKSEA